MQSNEHAIQEAMRLAQSDAGAKLIDRLRQRNPQQLQNVLDSAAKGDFAQAQQALSTLLSDPELQKLLKQLGR